MDRLWVLEAGLCGVGYRAVAPPRNRELMGRPLQHLLLEKPIRAELHIHGRPCQLAHRDCFVVNALRLRARQPSTGRLKNAHNCSIA